MIEFTKTELKQLKGLVLTELNELSDLIAKATEEEKKELTQNKKDLEVILNKLLKEE